MMSYHERDCAQMKAEFLEHSFCYPEISLGKLPSQVKAQRDQARTKDARSNTAVSVVSITQNLSGRRRMVLSEVS